MCLENNLDMNTAHSLPPGAWKAKHNMARIFINTWENKLTPLWQSITNGKKFDSDVWWEFVESKELWDMAWNKLQSLTDYSLHLFAYSEFPEEGDRVYLSSSTQVFALVPMKHAAIPIGDKGAVEAIFGEGEGWKRYACQQFLKTVLMYIFAGVYQGDFFIDFTSHEGMTKINFDALRSDKANA